ncbi:MAG: bifunctional phosphoribosylaminoimidazolecarboxamide formyltransferase/IMP cyclohydrolase [Acidobacteriota bacterium]|nr:bifunctional phosphoribosylaminoimidazolecarboxamide formyltransferase/IMP cyclohydrolase [Acidobacteriota bacterium]MDE3093420.1 bifunctional phosphoribosylaminoimidazolecarboxamide formyltransferase/IMP cyclohydrolase [Acidobacteriota bacterium]MDE3146177.1 bifunctional phosphoribosylaminoimidazolecarboxamide formyltransferase/IMP cyclohydrolase [Acidobacteriota bacterium]
MRALLSVWDKTGLVDFARGLASLEIELVASGGTARALTEAGVAHLDVAEVTGFPEMLGGRVKTLHPRIHGGILADRSEASHVAALGAHDIVPIDLVVCNLYPFATDPSIELIDVGGPTMVRAAAKNHHHVGVVTSPRQYDVVLEELRESGGLSDATRHELARAAFAHTAAYDAEIVAWMDRGGAIGAAPDATDVVVPTTLHLTLERADVVRYGENPHQIGARYRVAGTTPWWDGVLQHAGTALSYLNLFDADAAWRLVHELAQDAPGLSAVAIIKHANASGAAVAATLHEAFAKALDADPQSAFGGIIAVGGELDEALATLIAAGPQADVIIASSLTPGAIATLVARRKATRLLSAPAPEALGRSIRTFGHTALVQNADELLVPVEQWRCVSARQPTPEQLRDLALAWRVCARTTSNAIVLARDGVAVGVGAGQQSRVVAAGIATSKAGEKAVGSSASSDAFFPFADGLDALTSAGVTAVVQPGGSVRDQEVIDAANAADIVMMLTGERHFRH